MKYFLLALGFFLLPALAFAENGSVAITVYNEVGESATTFSPFGESYFGTLGLTVADLGVDGVEEIVVGSGPGLPGEVSLYRQDGSKIRSFPVYGDTYKQGVEVATCDLTGDGLKEIVTGTMAGGAPLVRVYTTSGEPLFDEGFFAYAEGFLGGVSVACGDITGDGEPEIVTGPGTTGGGHIRVFTKSGERIAETFIGNASEDQGAIPLLADITGDDVLDIVARRAGSNNNEIVFFTFKKRSLRFSGSIPHDETATSGIHLSASGDILTRLNKYEATPRRFLATGLTTDLAFTLPESTSHFFLNANETLAISATSGETGALLGKSIRVDLSEQKLYAIENGITVKEFLVSTGTYAYPTPLGKTEVTAKLPVHDYVWSYGENNPNNYALRGVKWNLRFRKHFYIHSAPWHNNFGRRMSHGCVNMRTSEAEWMYNWADVGTSVEIIP